MRTHSLKMTVERITSKDTQYNIALKEFIDGYFLEKDMNERQKLVWEEPELIGIPVLDVLIGGLVEQITDVSSIVAPGWINKESRRFEEPTYTTKNKELQKIYFDEAPIFYRSRNLFCGRVVSKFHIK